MTVLDTLLVITGIGIPDYSSRGITQTLTPIPASQNTRRTINGELVDISFHQFRKYSTKLSCTDQRVLALDHVFPGDLITVYCIQELCYPAPLTAGAGRDVRPGSERDENGFIFYKPILTMRVKSHDVSFDEWGAIQRWTLEAEEI